VCVNESVCVRELEGGKEGSSNVFVCVCVYVCVCVCVCVWKKSGSNEWMREREREEIVIAKKSRGECKNSQTTCVFLIFTLGSIQIISGTQGWLAKVSKKTYLICVNSDSESKMSFLKTKLCFKKSLKNLMRFAISSFKQL